MKYAVEQLEQMVQEINGTNGSLENLYFWENDGDFFQILAEQKGYDEIGRAIFYGDYNWNHPYIQLNAYGNIKTVASCEYYAMLEESEDEIIEYYIEEFGQDALIEEYGNGDEE